MQHSPGSKRQAQKLNRVFHEQPELLEGNTKAHARYLRGLHHYNNGFTAEKSARSTAVDKAWKTWDTSGPRLRLSGLGPSSSSV
eukprot:890893-Pyramimonas_sp.AAC.1